MFEKIKQTVLLKQYEIRKFVLTANVKKIRHRYVSNYGVQKNSYKKQQSLSEGEVETN